MEYRVAIVLAGNMEDIPYYRYYTDVFDKHGISYDIITWDRLSIGASGNFCFKYPSTYDLPFAKKIIHYSKYSSFVKGIISSTKYDLVIVTTIVNAVFLGPFLIGKFPNRYIIDIRDYSPIIPFIKRKLKKILKYAKKIYISSPGWKKWLPEKFNYIISHNVRLVDLQMKNKPVSLQNKDKINISTFGILRDYKTNQKLMADLGNDDRFSVEFNGSGKENLEQYAKENQIYNVLFGGRYNKEAEPQIINRADLINILLPRGIAHDGILSNRFYQGLIYRKPMIVSEGNIQAEFVSKYNLGLVVKLKESIKEKLTDYIGHFDPGSFEEGCNDMINEIKNDLQIFESDLEKIIDTI
jgi:hypothetical protein